MSDSGRTTPDVVELSGGGFVVVWQSSGQDGSSWSVYMQQYDAAGVKIGTETRVNTTTSNAQEAPAIAALNNGGFVVAWESTAQDGDLDGVYMQRYDASGAKVGSEVRVNTVTAKDQSKPAITVLESGEYVVAWQSKDQDGGNWGVYAQRYAENGTAQGVEFRVNTTTSDEQRGVSLTALSDGGFAAVWQSNLQDGGSWGVYLQRYDASGVKVGSETLVNTTTSNAQQAPSIDTLADGTLVVSWESSGQDGSGYGVYNRVYDASNQAAGAVTLTGDAGNDSFKGTGFADTLSGGAGNDRLEGGSGTDRLSGDAGDDTLLWDGVDSILGGSGTDTLSLSSGNIDLSSFTGTITGIEKVDLAASTGANTLTLTAQDVLNVSDTDTMTVLGTAADSVNAGSGWTDGGLDGQGNHVYTKSVLGVLATLVVDTDITVNSNILS
ncbi:MAG: calcium-binding protein [Rhodospirillales bacterium]